MHRDVDSSCPEHVHPKRAGYIGIADTLLTELSKELLVSSLNTTVPAIQRVIQFNHVLIHSRHQVFTYSFVI